MSGAKKRKNICRIPPEDVANRARKLGKKERECLFLQRSTVTGSRGRIPLRERACLPFIVSRGERASRKEEKSRELSVVFSSHVAKSYARLLQTRPRRGF